MANVRASFAAKAGVDQSDCSMIEISLSYIFRTAQFPKYRHSFHPHADENFTMYWHLLIRVPFPFLKTNT